MWFLTTRVRDFLRSCSLGPSICSGLQLLSESHQVICCPWCDRSNELESVVQHCPILSASSDSIHGAEQCTTRCKQMEGVKLLTNGMSERHTRNWVNEGAYEFRFYGVTWESVLPYFSYSARCAFCHLCPGAEYGGSAFLRSIHRTKLCINLFRLYSYSVLEESGGDGTTWSAFVKV